MGRKLDGVTRRDEGAGERGEKGAEEKSGRGPGSFGAPGRFSTDASCFSGLVFRPLITFALAPLPAQLTSYLVLLFPPFFSARRPLCSLDLWLLFLPCAVAGCSSGGIVAVDRACVPSPSGRVSFSCRAFGGRIGAHVSDDGAVSRSRAGQGGGPFGSVCGQGCGAALETSSARGRSSALQGFSGGPGCVGAVGAGHAARCRHQACTLLGLHRRAAEHPQAERAAPPRGLWLFLALRVWRAVLEPGSLERTPGVLPRRPRHLWWMPPLLHASGRRPHPLAPPETALVRGRAEHQPRHRSGHRQPRHDQILQVERKNAKAERWRKRKKGKRTREKGRERGRRCNGHAACAEKRQRAGEIRRGKGRRK